MHGIITLDMHDLLLICQKATQKTAKVEFSRIWHDNKPLKLIDAVLFVSLFS